jgi:hypothetical protein
MIGRLEPIVIGRQLRDQARELFAYIDTTEVFFVHIGLTLTASETVPR